MEKEMEKEKNIMNTINYYYLKENIYVAKNGMERDMMKKVI